MTPEDKIISQTFLDILNELFKSDPSAIECLIKNKVTVNKKVADFFFCSKANTTTPKGEEDQYQLGALGLINTILDNINGDKIAAQFDLRDNTLIGFGLYDGHITHEGEDK